MIRKRLYLENCRENIIRESTINSTGYFLLVNYVTELNQILPLGRCQQKKKKKHFKLTVSVETLLQAIKQGEYRGYFPKKCLSENKRSQLLTS